MAAPRVLQQCRALPHLLRSSCLFGSDPSSNLPKGGILQYLCDRFYDIENVLAWREKQKYSKIERQNRYHGHLKEYCGDDIVAVNFTLYNGGGVRFKGQEKWLRPNKRGKYSKDFLVLRDVLVEAIDLSGSVVSYDGLDNLVFLTGLKSLDLSRCPNIDDWSLSRLHVFKDSLEELLLTGCPRVTERGLACLHQLECLRHLDISNLPSIANKGLILILLEEMLPQCKVVGMDYGDGVALDPGAQMSGDEMEEPSIPSRDRKAGEIPA
uniref:Distal membrane-arm assembly complex protein 2 n=1 Tax=Pelusios castaneus TaxID=367368 RepID=A0A8C8REF5_9SAUR